MQLLDLTTTKAIALKQPIKALAREMQIYKLGDRGNAIIDIQMKLLAAGYALGPRGVDGRFGSDVQKAVQSYQSDKGLNPDGIVGTATWKSLLESTYKLGDRLLYVHSPFLRGKDVHDLQTILGQLGFRVGKVDGIFGPLTDRAVREFQSNLLLPADGIVGAYTLKSLKTLQGIIDSQPRGLLPWKLMKPQTRLKPLKGSSIQLTYLSPEKIHIKRNIAKQITNLLRIAGAKVNMTNRGSAENHDAVISIDCGINGKDSKNIVIKHAEDMENFANLAKKTLSQIAGIRSVTMFENEQSGKYAAICLGKAKELEICSDEALFQKFAVSIADAISTKLCEK